MQRLFGKLTRKSAQQRNSVTEMEDENSWVFDSLVAFLNGPIWSAPLESFIEEKSLIFEPNVTENEDYKKIFDEFKNLVDFMLGNLMEDIGITPAQFEEACNKGHSYPINFDHNIFEQIWAANDYEMFKRMMTQRNVELQLQALELIEQKYGITPQLFLPNKITNKEQIETAATIETERPSVSFEKEIMKEVAKNFPQEASTSNSEVQFILEEKEILEKSLKKNEEEHPTPVDEQKVAKDENIEGNVETTTEIQQPQSNQSKKIEVSPAELLKRQEYLKSQRDKLVAMKKEARKKHLGTENTTEKNKSRPKSAKAAQAVLAGENVEAKQLQIRKALAERLKTEVVEQKSSIK